MYSKPEKASFNPVGNRGSALLYKTDTAKGPIGQLTIEQGLADSHDRGAEADQDRGTHCVRRSPLNPHPARLEDGLEPVEASAVHPAGDQVVQVSHAFHDVQRALRRREADVVVPGGEAVHEVHLGVERVGFPDGAVQRAAGHGVRAQEDIAGVPGHEDEGDDQPGDGDRVRDVDVAAGGGGGSLPPREGFRRRGGFGDGGGGF